MSKRLLALFISTLLIWGALPFSALAEGEEGESGDGLCPHHQTHSAACTGEDGSCRFTCAVCAVQALIDELPDAGGAALLEQEEQAPLYGKVRQAADAYQALSEEQRLTLTGADKLTAWLDYFKAEQQPAQASPLAEQQPARQRDGAANYDQILTVGPGGYANIQSALDSLQGDNNGSVLVQLSQAYALGYTTVNVIPADKGITSVTIAAAGEEQIKLGTYEDYALFANGIPLIIEKGMVFGVGAKIYGGGSEGQDVNSGTSITISQQAAVKGVVYGGGKNSSVAGDSEIHIYGEVGSVFGGGYAYAVSTQTRESYHADVNGKTEVYLADTARLTGNVYGGGTAYANSDNTVTKTLQANIGQSVWLTIDSPYITGDIYGGGSVSTTYRGYDKTLRADVQGDVTITLGGSMQFTSNPGESLYGGGTAQSFFNVGDSGDGVPLLSACVNGHVKIDASRDDDASSGHDDWDNSVFMRLYGGGHAKGRYTDATVGSTEIITARKAVDDAAGLFGGGNAEVGGKALVKGNTSVEVVTVANQASGHDNAKNVFGGGRGGYYADATVGGNTTVKINGDISFEPGGVSGVYGGGWVTEEGGSADVTGTAQIILVDTKFSQGVCPGGKGGSITNAATVQAIGESTLAIRDTDGTITQPLSITVGDGLTPTNAKTYFLYNWDGAEKKIDRITINEQATLTQMSNGNVLFWKTEDLYIASGGKVIIDNTKTNNETINGTLSGEGTVQLPAGRQLVVWGGFSGKIALAISGTAAAGSTIAWSPREQDGRFTYQGEGLALAMTDTTEWYRWDLRELRTIRAAVTNPQGGTITPAEQQIAQGEDASLTITCNPGYKVGSILVNGAEQVSALQGNTYTLAEVEQDTTVSVTFTTLQVPDVAGLIDQLPNIDPGSSDDPPLTEQEHQTILDVKLHYETMTEEEKAQIHEDYRDKLNAALAALPEVEISVSGDADVLDPHILLENMSSDEAAALKNKEYQIYQLVVQVDDAETGTAEEEASITAAIGTAEKAAQYDVNVKKKVVLRVDPHQPLDTTLSTLVRPIQLKFAIPASAQAGNGRSRVFHILRTHLADGSYTTTELPLVASGPDFLAISSDQFSLYTLIYEDISQTEVFHLTAQAGSGGSITPQGEISVARGESQTFTIKVDAGYQIKEVLVDGQSVGKVDTYTFANVTDDHQISVSFIKEPGGGAIPNSGDQNRHFYYWSVLALIAGGALCYLISRRQKKDA